MYYEHSYLTLYHNSFKIEYVLALEN